MASFPASTSLKTRPLAPCIGCEIVSDKETLLSGAHSAEIRRLLVAHGVLCFTDIGFDDREQVTFARSLGKVADKGKDGIWKVSADSSVNPNPVMAEYQKSSVFWHFDGFGVAVPEFATVMGPRVLEAGKGGATEFANCHAAYRDLPEADKQLIDRLKVRHSFEWLMRMVKPWPTYAELKAWQDGGHSFSHPLVWHHTGGSNSLLLGASAASIEGMDAEEGRALICRLNEWITRPQYVVRYEWRLGDLVIWDNTGTLHRAVPYAYDSGRLMHRSTLAGEEAPV